MKNLCRFARRGMWILFLVLLPFPASALTADDPPDLEKGWNLIASPCNVSTADLKQRLGSEELQVFEWNGEAFIPVDTLVRGHGYALNSNAVISTSYVCDPATSAEIVTLELQAGWNLIGNPYRQALPFWKAFGKQISVFSSIFEYRGNQFVEVTPKDQMKVWSGYWVYVDEPATIILLPIDTLPELRISADDEILRVGGTLAFHAVLREAETQSILQDVTPEVTWILSDSSLGSFEGATLTALATGTLSVSASLNSLTSNSVELSIRNNSGNRAPGVYANLYYTSSGNMGTGTFPGANCAFSVFAMIYDPDGAWDIRDVTVDLSPIGGDADSKLLRRNEHYGSYVEFGGGCVSIPEDLLPGSYEFTVTATDSGGLQGAAPITLEVHVLPEIKEIRVNPRGDGSTLIQIHESLPLAAHAVFADYSSVEITNSVSWTVTPEDAGKVDVASTFYPSRLGTAAVTATWKGITSHELRITTAPKQLIVILINPEPNFALLPTFFFGHNVYLNLNDSGKFSITVKFNDGDIDSADPISFEWQVSDPEVLSNLGKGKFKGKKEGVTSVRACAEGICSMPTWVEVVSPSTQSFLLITTDKNFVRVEDFVRPTPLLCTRKDSGGIISDPGVAETCDGWCYSSGDFFCNDVYSGIRWLSGDSSVLYPNSDGLYAQAPGRTSVQAEYQDLKSNIIDLEVWTEKPLPPCNPDDPNMDSWTDGQYNATLEASCKTYAAGDPVGVQFTAGSVEGGWFGAANICLDLYIYNSSLHRIRTIRDVGCSNEPLFKIQAARISSPGYQFTYTWDRRDDKGTAAPPGDYIAVARFYILYEPILKVYFTLQ